MTALQPQAEKRFEFLIAGERFIFSSKKWNELIDNSRIAWFIRDFVAQNKWHDGLLFFQEGEEFPDLVMNPSIDGQFFLSSQGEVDGRFTRNAFEQQVRPVLLELPEFLKTLPIPEEEKTGFSNFVYDEVAAYAEHYVIGFLNFYSGFEVRAKSLGELRYVLTQMQMPSSQFQDFLVAMKENTALELGDNPYLRPFVVELRKFSFIQRLMQEHKGTYPELDKYRAILAQMEEDLASHEAVMAETEADDAKEFRRELSPLGKISLAIFRNDKDSYLNMVNIWLKSVGGEGREWHIPFLAPVHEAYDLGLVEVQATINRVWGDLWKTSVQPLITNFPFNVNADAVVAPSMLEATLNPQQGSFWQTFKRYLAPVYVETNTTWRERTFPKGSLDLPPDILTTVNGLARLTRALWNEKGLPQPLRFSVKALPLPLRHEHEPAVVLSYLKCGKESIFGFNQQPSWQNFTLEWWKEHPAVVGIEFKQDSQFRQNYQTITIPQSTWSFYRLLQRAEPGGTEVLTWRLESPELKNRLLNVQFSIKSDPWALFQLRG
jgi:type VI secretion system protein ImpL